MDKSPTIEALLTGLAGTSAMTLFSYLTDRYRQENLQIPVLLGGLLKDTLPQEYQHCAKPAGWTAHYTIGIGWSWVFKVLYRNAIIPPTIKNGFVTGLFSGGNRYRSVGSIFQTSSTASAHSFKSVFYTTPVGTCSLWHRSYLGGSEEYSELSA